MSYQTEYDHSMKDPAGFWRKQAEALEWFRFPRQILSLDDDGLGYWFADGEMNTAYMALDHHVKAGRGNQLALIYDSPVTNTKSHYTYAELTDIVARTAGMLANLGVVERRPRDHLHADDPRSGHRDARGGKAGRDPLGGIRRLRAAGAGDPHRRRETQGHPHRIVRHRDQARGRIQTDDRPRDRAVADTSRNAASSTSARKQPHRWSRGATTTGRALLAEAKPVGCTPVKGSDPLYILYTSGTTGKPKGVLRENGGHAVALKYSMKAIYNVEPGDVYWASSDVGWVVGHSYIVYGPLLHGCTTIVYEGKPIMTPDAGALWRVCAEYGVKALFTAPTAFRAVKKEDPQAALMKSYDLRQTAGDLLRGRTARSAAPSCGSPKKAASRWWTTGGRPRPAGRSPPICRAWSR